MSLSPDSTRPLESLQELMRNLRDQGKALIFSTHDFEQGRAIAERLVALEDGKVRYDGPISSAPPEALATKV